MYVGQMFAGTWLELCTTKIPYNLCPGMLPMAKLADYINYLKI